MIYYHLLTFIKAIMIYYHLLTFIKIIIIIKAINFVIIYYHYHYLLSVNDILLYFIKL
jgi:hypothetical protein